MLSRVADAIYWIGRYVERAENVSRMLMVAAEASAELEGLDEALAQRQWDTLAEAVSSPTPEGLAFSPESGLALPYVQWLLLDAANPVSVRFSLERARDNARSVRESLNLEVFTNLNEAYLALEAAGRRRKRDPVAAYALVRDTHRDLLTILGAIEHSLSRDQGWTFMKLGEAMERTQRTLQVLAAKLPFLGEAASTDTPLYNARWRALLRSLASLENYRATRGADMHAREVQRFLLFETSAPRSVRCGVERIQRYLGGLPGSTRLTEADRILGRLDAELTYDEERILDKDVAAFCTQLVERLTRVHESIAAEYFPV